MAETRAQPYGAIGWGYPAFVWHRFVKAQRKFAAHYWAEAQQ